MSITLLFQPLLVTLLPRFPVLIPVPVGILSLLKEQTVEASRRGSKEVRLTRFPHSWGSLETHRQAASEAPLSVISFTFRQPLLSLLPAGGSVLSCSLKHSPASK